MPRLAEALVGVAVVHGNEVDIAEDEAVVIVLLQGLRVANVQQLGSVEGLVAILTHTQVITGLKVQHWLKNRV